uniref:Uncharacterized protein n=1 Tax=viral metagenome TaxID=1070528 RepID=A0A6M3XYU6_9ZZZZ
METSSDTKDNCKHHWLINTIPEKGQYPATCKLCGAEATFPVKSDWELQGFRITQRRPVKQLLAEAKRRRLEGVYL